MEFDKGEKFEKIIMYLSILRYIIESKSKNNLTDVNVHAEDFFCTILNMTYDWNLKNLNEKNSRFPGIDLGGDDVAVQITATNKSGKIKKTLKTFSKEKYHDTYGSLYIFIITNKLKYKKYDYNKLVEINFDIETHVIDMNDLLRKIEGKGREEANFLTNLCSFLEKELPNIQSSLSDKNSLLSKYEKRIGSKAETLNLYYEVNSLEDIEDASVDIEDLDQLYEILNKKLSFKDREILYMLIDVCQLENNDKLIFNEDIVLSKVFDNDKEQMEAAYSIFNNLNFLEESFEHNSLELKYNGINSGYNLLAGAKSYAVELSNKTGSYSLEELLKRIIVYLEFSLYDSLK